MLRIGSPVSIASMALIGAGGKFLVDAMPFEEQAVHKLAVRIIRTFYDKIPPSCLEKKEDILVLNCFVVDKGTNFSPSEGSSELIQELKQYESHLWERQLQTMGIALTVLTTLAFCLACRATA
jgi:hypothetical protein